MLHEQNTSGNCTTLFSPRKPFSFAVFGSLRTKGIRAREWLVNGGQSFSGVKPSWGFFSAASYLPTWMSVSCNPDVVGFCSTRPSSAMEGVKLKSGWKKRWTGLWQLRTGGSEADPAAAPSSHINRGHAFLLKFNPFPSSLQRCWGAHPRLSEVIDVLVLMEMRQLASAQDLKTRTITPAPSPDPGVSLKKKNHVRR